MLLIYCLNFVIYLDKFLNVVFERHFLCLVSVIQGPPDLLECLRLVGAIPLAVLDAPETPRIGEPPVAVRPHQLGTLVAVL